jgi:hypothetical protein
MTDEMRCLRLREAKGNIILFIYKKNEAKREKSRMVKVGPSQYPTHEILPITAYSP